MAIGEAGGRMGSWYERQNEGPACRKEGVIRIYTGPCQKDNTFESCATLHQCFIIVELLANPGDGADVSRTKH